MLDIQRMTTRSGLAHHVKYGIGGREIALTINGHTHYGANRCPYIDDRHPLENTNWEKAGYCVLPHSAPRLINQVKQTLTHHLRRKLTRLGARVPMEFNLAHYHRLPNLTDDIHWRFAATLRRGLSLGRSRKQLHWLQFVQYVGNLCQKELRLGCRWWAPTCHIRIVRPGSSDFNPPHKDIWLNHLRHTLNIYLPIAGSHHDSSLPLMPGSHWLSEAEILRTRQGAIIEGRHFHVPAAINTTAGKIELVRPAVAPDKMLIFSPYLIHGGAANFGNETRISLEIRLRMHDPR